MALIRLKWKIKTFLVIVQNFIFYFAHKKPQLLSPSTTINYVIENNISLSRFGDGELLWMLNKHSYYFQDNNQKLAKRLLEVFSTRNDKVLIAIPGPISFINWNKITFHSLRFFFYWLGTRYKMIYSLFDFDYAYGDTYSTRFYIDFKDKRKKTINAKVKNLKNLWNQRNLLIVEGYYSRLGVGNDLFDNSLSIRRIICPNKNAFDCYDEILETTKNHYAKNDLVLLALGPTATVLAYDLQVKYGIQALDVGHIDSEYEWYKMGAKKRIAIENKHTAEINNDLSIENYDADYESQIIRMINI